MVNRVRQILASVGITTSDLSNEKKKKKLQLIFSTLSMDLILLVGNGSLKAFVYGH